MLMSRRIAIIGAPLCDGERELGVEKAPGAMRETGLVDTLRGQAEVLDLGDIAFQTPVPDRISGKLRNIEHVVKGCRRVMQAVAGAIHKGFFPLLIGGDCSLFPGAVAGLTKGHQRIGALYVDGHADFHTSETTSSGYFSGMALAATVGRDRQELFPIGENFPIIREEDVSVLGVRTLNLDPLESRNLERTKLNVITIDSLRRDGVNKSVEKATEALERPLYLHFDLDVIDSREMPALAGMRSGVHASGGLTFEEAISLCEAFASLPLAGMDITLYDPNLDPDRIHAKRIIQLLRTIIG
jgi:arginase